MLSISLNLHHQSQSQRLSKTSTFPNFVFMQLGYTNFFFFFYKVDIRIGLKNGQCGQD